MTTRRNRTSVVTTACTLVLACVCLGARAQTPPATERPARPLEEPAYLPDKPDETFKLPPVEDEAPAGSDASAGFDVNEIVIEGNRAIATEELAAIAAPYRGRKLTRIELEQLREALSRHYLARGYVNSGALLPDDFYRDGVVRVRIIEGHIEDVRLAGMGRLREHYVRERLMHDGEVLNVNTLQERFRLLLADPLFAKINARLAPGSALGLARLELDVTRARPWELAVFANNYRSPSVGSEALGVSGLVRNLTGLGDVLDASVQGGHRDNERYGVGWSVPLSARAQARVRYDNGRSSVLEEPLEALDVKSTLESTEAGIEYAFVESTRRRLAIGFAFTYRTNATRLLDEPFSFVPGEPTGTSKIDAWRFDQDFVQRWEKQAFAFRSTFTFGRTNTVEDPLLADIVAPKRYAFWLGQAQFTRRITEQGTDLLMRANVQLARDRLVPLERFAVGGVASVRGYRENQAVRDQGFHLSLELRHPLYQGAGAHRLTLIPFLDYGEAWNKSEAHEELSSAGLGLAYAFKGFSAELYYGKRLIDPENETDGDLQDDGVHVQVRYAF